MCGYTMKNSGLDSAHILRGGKERGGGVCRRKNKSGCVGCVCVNIGTRALKSMLYLILNCKFQEPSALCLASWPLSL